MLTQHIALVPETADPWQTNLHTVTREMLRVSAALQRQVSHDLGPLWGVQATVNVFASLEEVPVGYWPIVVRFGELGPDAGVHLDENGQPYARIAQGPLWSLAASRACLEMLINPFGDRCVGAPSPRVNQSAVEVLVEVSGPCANPTLAYPIDGVMVSDFCLPAFFTASARDSRERLSFRHALKAPFEPAAGGHLTWFDPLSNLWWLRQQGEEGPTDTNLGPVDRRLTTARTLVQHHLASLSSFSLPAHVEHDAESALEHAEGAARARASRLRSLLGTSSRPPVHELDEIEDDLVEELSEHTGSLPLVEVSKAVESASYDSSSDMLTQSAPPPLPGAALLPAPATRESGPKDTKLPVAALSSFPAPRKVRSTAGQLSSLSEPKVPSRRGVFGAGIAAAAVLAVIWFMSEGPRPRAAPVVQSPQQAKSSTPAAASTGAAALPPNAPAPASTATSASMSPSVQPADTALPAAVRAAPVEAPGTPKAKGPDTSLQDNVSQLTERRRMRRGQVLATQAQVAADRGAEEVPRAVETDAAPTTRAAPVIVPKPAPATATARATDLSESGDGLEGLIESRR